MGRRTRPLPRGARHGTDKRRIPQTNFRRRGAQSIRIRRGRVRDEDSAERRQFERRRYDESDRDELPPLPHTARRTTPGQSAEGGVGMLRGGGEDNGDRGRRREEGTSSRAIGEDTETGPRTEIRQ